MEVHVQLKTADGSVAGSLGYESAVSRALKEAGLNLYPRYPGTQDSRQGHALPRARGRSGRRGSRARAAALDRRRGAGGHRLGAP